MKISISPVVSGPAWGTEIVLVPGAEFSPENIEVDGTNVVELIHPLRSYFSRMFDRGNRQHTLSFAFTSQNASFILSEQDLIRYTRTVPNFGLVRFYYETALTTAGDFMIASVRDFKLHQVGVTSLRSFSLFGGEITTTVPVAPAVFP